ncbi:two-component sensor histidine kinase [Trinickia terrae]|uniref:histidine kinase n=1 Tax=Trinickia terrae TaxID=2571161 RepID=A0A4U1HZS4_9BURK|nr:ATP-binding protein [Trinickia terrae]TKC86314.1 two-component sensor histidine kinase [Trinickia terrae]
MDGFKRRLSESVQLRLSFGVSLAILLVAIVAGVFSFASAFDEAHEFQDDMLLQVSALFDRQHLPLPHLGDTGRAAHSDEESRVIVQYLAAGPNSPVSQDTAARREDDPNAALPDAARPIPAGVPDGVQTLEIGGEPFRVLVKTMATGERIAVAQETGFRDEMARDSALRTVTPFLILVPVLLLVTANLVRKMFRPIASLAAEIDRRGERELHAIDEGHLPSEVRPFVVAINRLLGRIGQSMEAQRRFVADAAHELRSPLTALSLQAERLADAQMSDQARERLHVLRKGIERGRSLLDQLLTLAHAQSAPESPGSPVSVMRVYRRVLEDLMPLAEAKLIDIGVEGMERGSDARVPVNEVDLIAVVKNLVDNAIRYTPERGRIDLSVTAGGGHAVLRVVDSGPGIPAAERERVFDPFYRVLGSGEVGSGLGLSIVKTIAERLGADVTLACADEASQTGLAVTVRIPLADA